MANKTNKLISKMSTSSLVAALRAEISIQNETALTGGRDIAVAVALDYEISERLGRQLAAELGLELDLAA
jgi:hypothetical protein